MNFFNHLFNKKHATKAKAADGDGSRKLTINYVVLFRWQTCSILDQTPNIAIDVNNGNFYLLYGDKLHKITDARFLEIAKETAPEKFEQYRQIALQKENFIKTCTLPIESIEYYNKVFASFDVFSKNGDRVCFENTSLDGWLMIIGANTIVLGERFFYESTIEELNRLINNYITPFEEEDLWANNSILEEFRLKGNCGYAPVKFYGPDYQKYASREVTDDITFKYENGILFFNGKGATSERDEGGDCGRFCSEPEKSLFCNYILSKTQKVVFGEGITKVGKFFLSDFRNLHEIVFASTITEFEKQGGFIFKCPPIKKVYLYKNQVHPFGKDVEEILLKK